MPAEPGVRAGLRQNGDLGTSQPLNQIVGCAAKLLTRSYAPDAVGQPENSASPTESEIGDQERGVSTIMEVG